MIPIPACAVVTAPAAGHVRRLAEDDTPVRAGEVVGQLDAADGPRPLVAPTSGMVGGALAASRQAVTAGEGVLWLSRT